jgi:hypothetical protein
MVKVNLLVDESVDAEDVVLCCDYKFTDYDNRIKATHLIGYTVTKDGKVLEEVEAL